MDNILTALGMCIIAASIIFASQANVAVTRALLEKEPSPCVCVFASPKPEGENK